LDLQAAGNRGVRSVHHRGGVIVQFLWNWLAPALFGWHEITFWQAPGCWRCTDPLRRIRQALAGRVRSRRWEERWEHIPEDVNVPSRACGR
jgi:hypothetical protein